MRGKRKKVQIILEAAQELIGGNKNMQFFFPKEDLAWTVGNDLILEARLQEKDDLRAEFVQVIENLTP